MSLPYIVDDDITSVLIFGEQKIEKKMKRKTTHLLG